MELRYFLENYNSLPAPERKAHLSKLQKERHGLEELLLLTQGDTARQATRTIADMGPGITGFIKQHTDEILPLLESDDPKVRMHAAQIIGNTCAAEHLDALINALESENTMYALPSMLLAIGSSKSVRAKEFLENYMLKSDVEKHVAEEKAALTKALSNFVAKTKVNVRILPTDVIFLTTPNANVTFSAIRKIGMKPKKIDGYIAVTGLDSFHDIYYNTRAFCDAYIYLGQCRVEELPQFIAKREKAIIQRTSAVGFRLEVKSVTHEVRLDIISKCVSACSQLINTPSSYSIELMIDIQDDSAKVLLNPLVDSRFKYRKKTVPASINAGVAACVCAYASEYFHEDARVLDNFCGSGTLLFERSYYPHHTLTGVDIDIGAIEAAKENSRFSNVHPQFHYMDALKFTAKKYDEIITNMPFGLRVSSHSQNERLYSRYFNILPDILTSDGIAVLYTHEKSLTEQLLKGQARLTVIKRATFSAGGLYPAVYVIRKNA